MKLNNKGFAITGVLYTVFILFLLIITSVLAGLQLKRTMLERSVLTLEDSYVGKKMDKESIKKINNGTQKQAPVTGKYIFNIRNNFYLGENSVDFSFDENEKIRTFVADKKGYYKLEVWGAQGGSAGSNSGGKGGYSSGLLFMDPTSETGIKELYVVVGGRGNSLSNTVGTASGGYNGGGNAVGATDKIVGSGGGATHIAITSGELSSLSSANVLIVAGGGGGSSFQEHSFYGYVGNGFGGFGGGLDGGAGSFQTVGGDAIWIPGQGGSRTSAGSGVTTNASFGLGGSPSDNGTGGGGGYYGGGAGQYYAGAGGGSGYVSTELINGTTIAGSQNIPEYPKQDEGNGHARITYYGEDAANLTGLTSLYGYTGTAQEFTVLEAGKYKIELWGAQGGSYDSTYVGGKGGYTSGYINLDKAKEEKLYVYVGGRGSMTSNAINQTSPGGYNGGGDGYNNQHDPDRYAGSGGGATDVRLKNGKWDDSLNSRIMVAAGGGGSWYHSVEFNGIGGFGGGLIGGAGTGKSWGINASIDGATQFPREEYSDDGYNAGTFGKGASQIGGEHPGAGGGYYGGNNRYYMSSGGSSYISGHPECTNHDSGKVFENTKMCDGNDELMPSPVDVNFMTGNSGDGYAKITYMGNGDVKVNDITCVAYLTKNTPIDFEHITFLTSDCNEAKKNSLFAFKASEEDYNVITLAAIYSFER